MKDNKNRSNGRHLTYDKKCENIAKIRSLSILFYRKYLYLQIKLNKIA